MWKVDFGLAGKVRPAIVVNVAATDSDRVVFCVVPHTTALRGSQFEIIVPVGFLDPGAFLVQGITNLTVGRFGVRIGMLNEPQMRLVEDGLRRLLAL